MNVIELFQKACLTMACILMSTGVKAQTAPPSLNKRVRVPLKEVNIITLGDMITAQTGFILSFNAQKIIAQKRLLLHQPSYSMHQLLTMIRDATGAEYTIYQDHVIFRLTNNKDITMQAAAGKQVAAQRPVATIRQPFSPPGKQIHTPVIRQAGSIVKDIPTGISRKTTPTIHDTATVTNVTTATATTASNTGITKSGISDTSILIPLNTITGSNATISNSPSYSLTVVAPVKLTMPVIKSTTPALQRVTSPVKRQREPYIYEKPGLFRPFVQAGFAADEVLYANLQAQAGVTVAYGIVSWSANSSVSGFRYGAGISYPLGNRWLIKLEATTGKLFKETPIQLTDDTATTKPPLYVNSQLQRISLLAQKRIAPHLSVYAGPVFNRLKSTYQLTTWLLNMYTLRLISSTPEKDYVTIRPPYTLYRSHAEDTKDVSTWIGFQIGISYRL